MNVAKFREALRIFWRYLRLYLYFLRFSLSKAMEFRLDYWTRIFMDAAFYASGIALYKILYLHTEDLAGWSEDQALVFIAGCFVVDAIHMTIFSNNLYILPEYVNKGSLDYYLLRPVSPLFMLSLQDFAGNSLVNLMMACSILCWALFRLEVPVGTVEIVMYFFLLLLGSGLHFVFHILFILPVFWTHSIQGGASLFYSISQFMDRPDRIYYGVLRKLLLTVLPFALMTSFPCHVLFGESPWLIFLHIFTILGLLCVLLRFAWARALMSYSSASS